MTTVVEPSPHTDGDPAAMAVATRYAGGDFISLAAELIHADTDVRLGPIGGTFNYSQADSTGLDAVITTGEAFIGGHWCAKDTYTTVTLQASTANQRIYLGVDSSEPHTLIFGPDTDFATADPKIPLYEFTTDSTSITDWSDLRAVGPENAITTLSYNKAETDFKYLHAPGGVINDTLDVGNHPIINYRLEVRTDRPADPEDGREILRVDTTPYRKEVYIHGVWRKLDLGFVNVLVDGFEDGTYTDNWGGSFSGTAAVTADAAIRGGYGLDMTNFVELYTFPGDGLPNFPQWGQSFRTWWRIKRNYGAHQYWQVFGLASTAFETHYSAEMTMQGDTNDASFRIMKRVSGEGAQVLDQVVVPDYVQDRVYQIEVDLEDTITCRLYDNQQQSLITEISGFDTELRSRGIGLRSSGSGRVNVDHFEII